ncbi:MAG: filamentous hemagglutinin N-terminal domain-containing protein, partial [Thermosynechococcaceae cyanobacterium]
MTDSKRLLKTLNICLLLNIMNLIFTERILADIKPDQTLGKGNSIIHKKDINDIPSELITGGTRRGSALFHSFQRFNINSGHGGFFSNPTGVSNIIARITGSKSSNINGVLGVLGNANLFLINPNGIIFGKNAQLSVHGSFTATTADSIIFPDYEFSASQPQKIPILKIDIPIGLNFTNKPADIIVKNDGFKIYQPKNNPGPPEFISPPPDGLSVTPGKSISLIGGNVIFDGGVI